LDAVWADRRDVSTLCRVYAGDPPQQGENRMSASPATERVASLIDQRRAPRLGVLGPALAVLTPTDGSPSDPCVMRGTIPPGVSVPLHSHADPETFLAVSGEVEGLAMSAEGFAWIPIRAGDIFHVPGGARHAFRNHSPEPVVTLLVTTVRLARFFHEAAAPDGPGGPGPSPSDDAVRHFAETAARYGHWLATPEENAAVGLHVGA
jgi:quercetin dioxygenase-like cupin family protein